jgi:putative transcriptional regulator
MTVSPSKHPDDATLMSYAAGGLSEPLAAVVAVHVVLCQRCRAEMRALDALGGLLLADCPVGPLRQSTVPARPEEAGVRLVRPEPIGEALLPDPFLRRFGLDAKPLAWRRLAPGIRQIRLRLSGGVPGDLRLLNIAPGRAMPVHGHGGTELTLVLSGSFHDATGRYGRGDIQDVDDEVEHQPIVEEDGCICLVASERRARFKGLVSRLLQPLTGM